jgi:mRNA-degrading endonuclease toxin of MazEF toxin-antitoxin module
VTRGEIWWYEPPDAKRRPVLILTRAAAIDRLAAWRGMLQAHARVTQQLDAQMHAEHGL